jgi:hypothetical protein
MGIIIREQFLLLVDSCRILDTALWPVSHKYAPGSPTVNSFAEPFEALVLVRLDILLFY